jgi:hypothetical protein
MFRKERASSCAVAVLLAGSCLLLATSAGYGDRAGASVRAIGSAKPASSTTPADGRLRGPDFAADVSSVAWPERYTFGGKSEEPPPGHRFVVFALSLSERTAALPPEATQPLVSAAVQWDTTTRYLTLTSIDSQIANSALGAAWATGSASYVATVANTTHDVNLVVTEGTFSQSFNLWTLQRNAPAPAVLYRDISLPPLSGSSTGSTSLALSNPADGFTDTATLSVQSATLSYFAPSGDAVAPTSPDEAVLSVVLDGEHSGNSAGLTDGSGHYLGAESPLPGSMVTFTPSGGTATAATLSDSGDTTGKGGADDGLFDATYSFIVPSTLAGGTVSVASGSFTGAEYTLFTPEQGTTTLDVTAPASLNVSFPPIPVATVQKKPPWVGAPLPPTAATASAGSSPSPPHSFPIWLAVVLLVVLAGVVVVAQQRHRRRTVAGPLAVPTAPSEDIATRAETESPARGVPAPASALTMAGITRTPITPALAVVEDGPFVCVVGSHQVHGWLSAPERRIVEELLIFLVLHDTRLMSADQIQVAMRPTEGPRPDAASATFHSYLSMLRQCIGADHLPVATNAGYRIVAVGCDWLTMERLATEADHRSGTEAIELRRQALALVRGVPFADAGAGQTSGQYSWVSYEGLDAHMREVIVTCALRAANDLFALGLYDPAEQAVRAGLAGAPQDPHLGKLLERIVETRHEGLVHPGRSAGDTIDQGAPDDDTEDPEPTA